MKAPAGIAAILGVAVALGPSRALAAGNPSTSTATCQAAVQAVATEVSLSPTQRQEMLQLCSGWASQWGAWRGLLSGLCRAEEQALEQAGDASSADQLQQACAAATTTPASPGPSGARSPTPLTPAGGSGGSSSGNALSNTQVPSVSTLSDTTGKCSFLWWFCNHYDAETDQAGNGLQVGAAVVQSGSGDGLLLKVAPTSSFVAMSDAQVADTASSLVQQLQDAGAQVAGPVVSTVANTPLLATGDIQAVSLIAALPGVLSEGVDSYQALGLTGLGLTSAAEASNELALSPDLPASVAKVLNGMLSGISSWEETHDFWPALEQQSGLLQVSDGTSYDPTYVAGPGQALLIYVGGVSGTVVTKTLQIDPGLTFVDTGLSTLGLGSAEGQGLAKCQASPCTVSEEKLPASLVLNPV